MSYVYLLYVPSPSSVRRISQNWFSNLLLRVGINTNRSEGFALTGYDIPGCMEDGAWMLWENSSVVAAAAVAAAAVAHPGLEKLLEFHYGIGPSGVRGSIRLVFRSTDARILRKVVVGKFQISKKSRTKSKTAKTGIA